MSKNIHHLNQLFRDAVLFGITAIGTSVGGIKACRAAHEYFDLSLPTSVMSVVAMTLFAIHFSNKIRDRITEPHISRSLQTQAI